MASYKKYFRAASEEAKTFTQRDNECNPLYQQDRLLMAYASL